jgi:2-hydroxy-6-oxonona-2,4-dienedioate hydrolase
LPAVEQQHEAMMNVVVRTNDRFVTVDGLNIRYLEDGGGVPAILLHGSSLGSSADVFRRNLPALAAGGVRAIAVDLPGFGKSDPAPDLSGAARNAFILRFIDALGLKRAALIGHSSSGGPAISIALKNPERVSHVIVLGTGSLLPPLESGGTKVGGREGAAQARLEERMVKQEPAIEETRALLEANLFHHELITEEELALRHQNSIGRCFEQFVRRHAAAGGDGGGKSSVPLWQRLIEVKQPLLLIYGRNDRARAEERAKLLKERYPQLDLHFADGCKHLVPWDAADLFHKLAVPFLTR